MMKYIILTLVFCSSYVMAQDYSLIKDKVDIVGRGLAEWSKEEVLVSDCFITLKEENPEKFEMIYHVKGANNGAQVHEWSGFGIQNRDNRYAVGLRGGNNNDLYLCRYQSDAKNEMLALASLDFQVVTEEWYKMKVVFWEGNIRIYLNDENVPRIVAKDENYLRSGSAVLGGGWLPTRYKGLRVKALSAEDIVRYESDSIKYHTRLSDQEKNAKRRQQRDNYQAVKIHEINEARTEISLAGNWLFMPGYQMEPDHHPYAIELSDNDWHVMQVPSFWNPVRNWLHLQDSHLPHRGSGISDNYREKEEARCEGYTFDYLKTSSAWYRHWIDIPKDIGMKKVRLHFDAVSKIADLYVNGEYVGGHIGMFGDFEFDITKHLKRGKNLIAIGVEVRKEAKAADADQNVARAVSVDITNDMLTSLPHGMFHGDEGGIWQDVKLVITDPIHIDDVFANVNANGGEIEVSLNNSGAEDDAVEVQIEIIDKQTAERLFISTDKNSEVIDGNNTTKLIYKTGQLRPKLWTPEQPNMYSLVTSVLKNGELVDETRTSIGFRTFEAIGNKFFLNGKPYWLRGANHPPIGIAPNDSKLANAFFKLMHDGNQMITRSHGCPFTTAWMNAADDQGIGLSYEGSWPWLMIGDMPSEELLDVWKEEMLSLVKKYRNHPSLLIWTINNEMYFTTFYKNDPPAVRLKKWKVISDLIKTIRELSPNTAISSDSGYGRVQEDYKQNLEPHGIDDGDIDDRHVYFNWYNRDFYQVFNGEWAKRIYWSPGANPDRPFFSQETSTGYTNNDDGHFNRKYLFNNYVPQAWVGDCAYEDKDPAFTLQRHAFMTKELMEVIRRTSPESAGVLLFANLCWFRDVFKSDKIAPYPVYDAVKKANSPVLISAELFGRNYFAGTIINPRICLVNNDVNGEDISASELEWEIVHDGKTLSSGTQNLDAVNHYERLWVTSEIKLPNTLPSLKAKCKLLLSVRSDNRVVATNEYDVLIADKNWADGSLIGKDKVISVFDLTGETCKVLDNLGVSYRRMKDLTEIRTVDADLLIIANLDSDEEVPYNWEDVKSVCGNGSNVLLIHPGKHLQWLYYDTIESVYDRKGRVVNMHVPEHGCFNEIGPLELAWWQQEGRERPRACRRSFRLKSTENVTALCTYLRPHTGLGSNKEAYLEEMSGIPLMEIKEKKGRLIASEMETNEGDKDPVAARLLLNLIDELLK
jgi:hypothetical protein